MIIEIDDMNFEIPDDFVIAGDNFENFQKVIYNSLKAIIDTDNIRIIVIETWLISEYFVRMALAQAIGIHSYKCDKIDPLYDLLPQSFQACIKMLKKLIESQRKLPKNEEDMRYTFTGSTSLLYYMHKKYPDVYQRIMEIQEEYNINKGWTKRDNYSTFNIRTYFGPYQNEQWVNSMNHLNPNWFSKIEKINKIRIKAAHNYNSSMIYEVMNISGETAFDDAKNYCLKFIYEMFSISIVK